MLATAGGSGCGGGNDGGGGSDARYRVASVVFGPAGQTSDLNVLASLDARSLDDERAIELPGWADAWVHACRIHVPTVGSTS